MNVEYYIFGTALSIMIAYFGLHSEKMSNKKFLLILLSSLPLMFVASVRYGVGTDFFSYRNIYYGISNGRILDIEIIYYYINRISSIFVSDYQNFLWILSALLLFPIFNEIFDDSPYVCLSIFLFVFGRYYFAYMNIMREMISCSIIFYSIRFIEKRRFWKFILCLLVATGIHYAAIIFLPAYWLYNTKIPKKVVFVVLFLSIIISKTEIASLINNILMRTTYERYFGSKYDTGETKVSSILFHLIILLFAYLFDRNDKKYNFFVNIYTISTWIVSLTGSVPFVDRARYYYDISMIILIPMSINNVKNKGLRTIIYILIFLCFLFYGYKTLNGSADYYDAVPYVTFWMK